MLLSAHYAEKQWTSHERRAAQSRAFTENREYILPVRIDDTLIDGFLDTTAYVDARKKSPEQIAELVVAKVRAFNEANGIEYSVVRAEEVLKDAGIRGPNDDNFSDADIETECPTCNPSFHRILRI